MTDKDKIKFAIRYLKQGLKSKRTPPLYAELMNELGFVKKDKVNNLISVAEVRLANWQKYEKENAELKGKLKNLESVAKVRLANWQKYEEENKELKEQIEALANVNIKAQNIIGEAKDLIRNLLRVTYGEGWNYSLDVKVKAEQFLKETVVDS